jgi:hypothetical protein
MIMKKITYTREDGSLTVVHPVEGARLCRSITLADGRVMQTDAPVTADLFFRGWPVAGVVADWAETEDEFAARVAAKDVPADTQFVLVDEADIPTDRSYRGAWVQKGAKVDHDMSKAREIHKDHLRKLRAPLLGDLDTQYMRADETGDAALKRSIAARKQQLRDVTKDPRIAAAATVEDLKALSPDAIIAAV